MPQACQCSGGFWMMFWVTCFNFWLALKWSGTWTQLSLKAHNKLSLFYSVEFYSVLFCLVLDPTHFVPHYRNKRGDLEFLMARSELDLLSFVLSHGLQARHLSSWCSIKLLQQAIPMLLYLGSQNTQLPAGAISSPHSCVPPRDGCPALQTENILKFWTWNCQGFEFCWCMSVSLIPQHLCSSSSL